MNRPGWATAIAVTAICLSISVSGCVSTPLPPIHYDETRAMRIVSYNVHFADATEGLEHVERHADKVAQVLLEVEPDLACLQEVSTIRFPRLVHGNPFRGLLEEELRQFGWIGPRGASQMAGTSPILYRLDRYVPVRQGVHWFSETPAVPDSTHWGNDLPRHMTWALLFDARAGQHVFAANVHLDPWSRTANLRAVEAVERVIRREARRSPDEPFGSVPVILCGDFNEPLTSPVRGPLENMLDSVLGVGNGPTRRGVPALQIDGIYVSEDLTVTASVVRRRRGPSDHYPLIVDVHLPSAPDAAGD